MNPFQYTPSQIQQGQAPSPVDVLDDMDMFIESSFGSFRQENVVNERMSHSLAPIDETSPMAAYSGYFDQYPQQQQQQQQRQPSPPHKHEEPFSFGAPAAVPTANAQQNMSMLSKKLNAQASSMYAQGYASPIAMSPMNYSYGHNMGMGPVAVSPVHERFMNSLGHGHSHLAEQQQDAYLPMKDEDFDFSILSPVDTTPPTPGSNWSVSGTAPVPIRQPHGRSTSGGSGSSINSNRGHPYPRHSNSFINNEMMSPLSPMSMSLVNPGSLADHGPTTFLPHQQEAAQQIFNYKQIHPKAAIPASFITSELAEVKEGRGWCLIGNCGLDRAAQRANPHYDITKDLSKKRLDHLYDHIRDKHFDNRPFRCSMAPSCRLAFAREHDLKRHELTHQPMSLPCDFCDKVYTRNDNLKRHVQIKHSGVAMSLPTMSRVQPGTSFTSYGM